MWMLCWITFPGSALMTQSDIILTALRNHFHRCSPLIYVTNHDIRTLSTSPIRSAATAIRSLLTAANETTLLWINQLCWLKCTEETDIARRLVVTQLYRLAWEPQWESCGERCAARAGSRWSGSLFFSSAIKVKGDLTSVPDYNSLLWI